ncbi:MAG: hypothetical protein CGW95_08455 [Phenylobacterium zucineum]|nr:MAG: hypothetical protein CGW95_08455 [Phenylobacterium zucineum]
METDLPEGGSDKTLNRLVAMTVVILSVFMGLSKVKDDNLVQAMQQAKADSVDRWSEYQAVKTKLHIAETARLEIALTARGDQVSAALQKLDSEITKYKKEAPQVQDQAKRNEALYDALNVHDDQFDMSDALISIAVSLAAVAALVETRKLLYGAWLAGGLGVTMGLAGFLGWSLHPDFLAKILS